MGAIQGMDSKGVLSEADFTAINAGLGKAIASVPTSTVMDVYNAMAKVVGDTAVPNKLYSTVNPQDAQAAYNALVEFIEHSQPAPRLLPCSHGSHWTCSSEVFAQRP